MEYKRYDKYKDSGVELIGEIPEDWDIKRLKYVATVQPSNVDKKSNDEEERIKLCNYVDVYKNEFIDSNIEFMESTATDSQIKKFAIKLGDVIVTKDSESPNDIAIPALVKESFNKVVCGYHLTQIRSNRCMLLGEYLFRLFQSNKFRKQFEISANGITRFGLSISAFSNAIVCLPSVEEQEKIFKFIDRKTSKIDNLIADKEKLIELLQEQRQAIITEAVTKGLNSNVRMKNSGIEWIGEIPEHWEINRVKYLSDIISKGTTPSTTGREILDVGNIRFLKAENISDNKVVLLPEGYIDEETDYILKRSRLKENDLLFVIAGATLGKVAILNNEYLPANTNQAVSFIRLKPYFNVKFVWYWLQSNGLKQTIWLEAVQSAQPNISMNRLGNMNITFLPVLEQMEIVESLDRQISKVDDLLSDIKKQIQFFKDYRQSLISEAVTGKIDVRGYSA
jgi:type I restriction enzyme S subunit